jgi:hypothetical protein
MSRRDRYGTDETDRTDGSMGPAHTGVVSHSPICLIGPIRPISGPSDPPSEARPAGGLAYPVLLLNKRQQACLL